VRAKLLAMVLAPLFLGVPILLGWCGCGATRATTGW
jgi:hypothetical protein